MRSVLTLAGFGCAALAAGVGFLSAPAPLAAGSGTLVTLADTDGDLLDDALELRLGTDPNFADKDQDGRTDLEEYLLGSRPNVWDDPQFLPGGCTSFRFEVYQNGPDFVLEFFALVSNQVHSLALHRADPAGERVFTFRDLMPKVVDSIRQPTSIPGFDVQRLRVRVQSSWFESRSSVAFAAVVAADNVLLGDSVILTHADQRLAEVVMRMPEGTPRGSAPGHNRIGAAELGGSPITGGNEKTGGLFPVDPGDPGTSSGTADEVCVQTLVPIGNLGGGRVQYVVADATCDPEPGAICMPGCAATKDDLIIGIDVVGLLGG
ncbi:MAG: hypothetical protein D6702_02035 [Planctomycetota bacterium]|nr:MAG: hypothetical protein D6702_02035 [Planctomycetota bacterium]